MRTIELAPDVFSSALGFGCAPVMGSKDGQASRRAIQCALDCGVTHFDLARSYGYGEAEKFVGKTIRVVRHELTLASKFGVQANWKSSLLKPLKPIIRGALRQRSKEALKPSSAEAPSIKPSRFLDNLPITAALMRKSLERSLKALGTDYLDVYMIHDPVGPIGRIDELAAEAQALKANGKIRSWGLAFYWENLPLHADSLERFEVLQFDGSPGSGHYNDIKELRGNRPNILFSPLRGAMGGAEQVLSRIWADFPRSVVLCSMFKEAHIRQNAEWASAR